MKKGILFLTLFTLLASCNGNNVTESTSPSSDTGAKPNGSFVNEELKENIIDDNYRNYYEIFVASFADSNGDGVGDLNGITAKLDYLASIGYTGIWLTPIFASPSYHKYDTTDYFRIDQSFGTMDDLKNLVKEAHKRNIKVILDGVFNHTGKYNEWFNQALLAKKKQALNQPLTEEEENYASLYVFYDSWDEANKSGKKCYKAGGNDFYYEGNFASDMPELNFKSEFTYTKIKEVIDFYMADDINIDGFRLDAVKYYDLGDNDSNVRILSRIDKMVKDNNPNGYLVGECWDSNAVISKFYESSADSYFYFPASGSDGFIFSSCNNEGRMKGVYYRNALGMEEDCKEHIPAPFLNNHDIARLSFSKNFMYQNKFVLGLLGMLKGTTFHYYGDEIGMSSTNLPNGDYRDSSYRTHYYWDDETHEMECRDVEHSYKQNQTYPAMKTQLSDTDSILNYVKEVNQMRNSYPFIQRGEMDDTLDEYDTKLLNTPSKNILPIKKKYQNKSYKLLFNFSSLGEEEYEVQNDYKVKYVLTADKKTYATLKDNKLILPSYAIAVLSQE